MALKSPLFLLLLLLDPPVAPLPPSMLMPSRPSLGSGEGEGQVQRVQHSGGVGRSLSSLLAPRLFLELTAEYHCRQRLNRLSSISECLRIDKDTGSEEVEGGYPFRAAAASMLNSLDLTLTLAAAKGWTGRHQHGGG